MNAALKSDTRDQTNTFYGLLSTRAAALGDMAFVQLDNEQWSYAHLHRQAQTCANGLAALGCQEGARVGTLLENRLEFLAVWFATAYAGGVHIPLNTEYRGDILKQILEDITVQVMFCEDYLLGNLLEAMKSGAHGIRTVVVFGRTAEHSMPGVELITWADFWASSEQARPITPVVRSASALGAVIMTSGTTGVSKGVMVSDKHAITHGREAAEAYGITSSDILYTCLPLFHGNAAWASFLCALSAGARVVISKRFSASRFWDEVTQAGATQVALLGTMLHILA